MERVLKEITKRDSFIIRKYIENLTNKDFQLKKLINEVKELGQLFFVGGTIRDIVNEKKVDDLDIIVKVKTEKLDRLISSHFIYKKNQFGGYKIIFKTIVVDIWSIESNWVFREKLLEKNIKNLVKGTFFNFDSLIYDYSRNRIHCHYYNNSIKNNTLDILSNDEKYLYTNQPPEYNVTKAIIINKLFHLRFSEPLLVYIRRFFEEDANAYKKVLECSKKDYRIKIMKELDIDYFHKIIVEESSNQKIKKQLPT